MTVAVDQKPLLKVLGDQSLEDIPNARLRNIKDKTLRYRFRMVYIPGIRHKAADAASRYPTGPKTPQMLILPDHIATTSDSPTPPPRSFLDHIRCDEPRLASCSLAINDQLASSASSALCTIAVTWDRVKVATASNHDIVHLMSIIESGFPTVRHELPPTLPEYYQFRGHLYTVDGIILYKDRIVIPPSLRQHVQSVLHSVHQGVTSMTVRAKTTVFWQKLRSCTKDGDQDKDNLPFIH
ncbi:uncharacterized protein [Montipora foliosa]|uniref:uncharacterized protein n=1 Tax=Montipora foliosa TaxID=591990 RepID=UPI0035F1011E